jgi:hypothetical protein
MNRRLWFVASLIAALGFADSAVVLAHAQSGINVGTLTCQVASGWGYVVGSARPMTCTFTRYSGLAPERYLGTIYKSGLDLGYTQGGALVWSVIAPSVDLAPGVLSGTYASGTASATIGVGVGANGLVGGFFNSVMLQSLSIETNQGFNVAAGVAATTLSPG